MKKLISIILCICLMVMPINVTALDLPDTNTTEITDETIVNGESIETEIIDDSTVTISPNDNSPEAQAIRKILEHKAANGETVETMAQASGLINGGIYYIKNYFSGKYLNVHYGVDANGTNVYQWTKDGSTEQKFKVVYDSATDSYKIYAMCSSNGNNRVLDVVRNGSPLASGQNVDIWTPVDHTAQRLRLTYLIDGLYHIHMLGNKDLYFTTHDSLNGTSGGKSSTSAGNVYIRTFDVDLNQQWLFEYVGTSSSTSATPVGSLDSVKKNYIDGWAWRSDLPNSAISVKIYLNNTTTNQQWIITETADEFRDDLSGAGYGNGRHGFTHYIDWEDYPAGQYRINAYAVDANGNNVQISNSPQYYTNEAETTDLVLNISVSNTLSSGEEHTYNFTPNTTGTYVVQTTGSTDTYGTVNITLNGTVVTETDNNDGSGSNFRIVFYETAGNTTEIKVRHANADNGQGNYNIRVHRARAQIYTFNYGWNDIDTTNDASVPVSGLSQLGYYVSSNINADSSHAYAIDTTTGLKNFDSEIVFFSGHGRAQPQTNYNELIFKGDNYSDTLAATSYNFPDMSNVSLAVWCACYSAYKRDNQYISIAEKAYSNGAKTSIGWSEAIGDKAVSIWSSAFMEYLSTRHDVEASRYYADSFIEHDDPIITSYVCYGDTNLWIEPLTFGNEVVIETKNHELNIVDKLENDEYTSFVLPSGAVRYIKTINKTLTNEYFDVCPNGEVLYSKNCITEEQVIQNAEKLSNSNRGLTWEITDIINKEQIINSYEAYYSINGEILHIIKVISNEGIRYFDFSSGTEISAEVIYG